jgi:hypothetical protein
LDNVSDESLVLLHSFISSVGPAKATEILLAYFLTLKEIRMLDEIPRRGKRYDQTLDFFEPDAEATAAPARLPIAVFCKIIGRQPITVGRRKSTMNPTPVAAIA